MIFLSAALAANRPEQAEPVLTWLKQTKLEDWQIAYLVKQEFCKGAWPAVAGPPCAPTTPK